MQVFAQKSVLVVSIYFPLIALICTDIPCFRANPCPSEGDNFPLIALICTDIPCFRANPCPSVGDNFPLIALIFLVSVQIRGRSIPRVARNVLFCAQHVVEK